jgi:hypothetical protein
MLKMEDLNPKDIRGQHENRPYKKRADVRQKMCDHNNSFRTVESHYARSNTQEEYLHPDFTLTKMYNMYEAVHPEIIVKIRVYGDVFKSNINVGFGVPQFR